MPVPFAHIDQMWNALQWNDAVPVLADFRQFPVRFPSAPQLPGLYRVSILTPEFWDENALQRVEVDAAQQILDAHDAYLQPHAWKAPFVLTVGCSTNLRDRLQQHLGANFRNNRLLKGIRCLFPKLDDAVIRQACIDHMRFEVSEEADWRIRFLLERYGAAIEQPILDFKAES